MAEVEPCSALRPGEHGPTFGGNPLGVRWAERCCECWGTGEYQERSSVLGAHLHHRVGRLTGRGGTAVRGGGCGRAWIWVPPWAPAAGSASASPPEVLVKDVHGSTLRFAPPWAVEQTELAQALDRFARVLGLAEPESDV